MFDINLTIGKFSNIKKLVDIVIQYEEDIDIIKGRYVIDAKSIMGICSIDISQPVILRVYSDDNNLHVKLVKELNDAEMI